MSVLSRIRKRHDIPRCFVDRSGKRFSYPARARSSDWWFTAIFLTPGDDVDTADNGIALIEVDPSTGEPLGNGEPNDAYPHITCPVCRFTSYNANDIREGYCGRCHQWTGESHITSLLRGGPYE